MEADPLQNDEWRVEVELDDPEHGYSLGERLASLRLDDEARERLGGRVIVTRDGSTLYAYASDGATAEAAEAVIRELLSQDELTARVSVTRWHPVEEAWEDAAKPLPQTEQEEGAERAKHEALERRDFEKSGQYPWEVGIDLPSWHDTRSLAKRLEEEGLPVHRRWKYLLVGVLTEEQGQEIAERVRGEAPQGAAVEVLANPDDQAHPTFVAFGAFGSDLRNRLGF